MITTHLVLAAELMNRRLFARNPRPEGREGPADRRPAALLRRLRAPHAPPVGGLGNHLRRDIGLPPVAERNDWTWHR